MSDWKPNPEELKALRQFVGTDKTRIHLSTRYEYVEEGGCTHIATDGHTLCMRRAGSHVAKGILEIEKLAPLSLDVVGGTTPPNWSSVFKVPNCEGPNVVARGINPAYFARVARVERAAGLRASADYVAKPGTSKRYEKIERDALKRCAYAIWNIGCDDLDPWFFRVRGPGERRLGGTHHAEARLMAIDDAYRATKTRRGLLAHIALEEMRGSDGPYAEFESTRSLPSDVTVAPSFVPVAMTSARPKWSLGIVDLVGWLIVGFVWGLVAAGLFK